jgi:hypothetical protein
VRPGATAAAREALTGPLAAAQEAPTGPPAAAREAPTGHPAAAREALTDHRAAAVRPPPPGPQAAAHQEVQAIEGNHCLPADTVMEQYRLTGYSITSLLKLIT